MPEDRPIHLDVLVQELTPYRVHTFRRYVEEIPGLTLRLLVSTERAGFDWKLELPAAIECVLVGKGHSVLHQGRWRSWLKEWRKGARVGDLIAHRRPDAVLVSGYSDIAHARTILGCARRGIPVLLWADSSIGNEQATGLRLRLKRLILPRVLRRCDVVLPWGTRGREYYRVYGVNADRIIILPPDPDYDRVINISRQAIEAARQRYRLSCDRRRLLYVGRLSQEKRVDLLLSAFAQIADERPNWDVLIVGDGPLRARLESQVPEALRPRVTWAGAITTPQDLAPMYHLGHIFVLPSDYEPWGIVVNEATAAGLPLVCSEAVGAGGDLLQDGRNGCRFRTGDVSALREVLLRMTDDTTNLQAFGQASVQILHQWRQNADPVKGLQMALEKAQVRAHRRDTALTN